MPTQPLVQPDSLVRLKAALAQYRAIAALVGDDLVPLGRIWHRGTELTDPHPLIGLLLSDDERNRLGALDRGLTTLSLSAQLMMDFRKRTVTGNPNGIGDAEAALAELLVAGSLALAEAKVAIVPRWEGGPDIRADCGTDRVTVEVARVQRDEDDRRKDNKKRRAFGHWRAGRPAPEEIREHARQFAPARVLEYEVHPLGHGDAADRIERLIEKGKRKAKQLNGKPNPLLVFSLFRREMLFRQEMCRPTYMESAVLGGSTTGSLLRSNLRSKRRSNLLRE
jgi:hypothetical protein